MRSLIIFAFFASFSSAAIADANCPAYPKSEWMKEEDVKAKLIEQGYTIKKFKVEGNCYEIYGRNKKGQKVEIYFDAKTMAIVKSDIED